MQQEGAEFSEISVRGMIGQSARPIAPAVSSRRQASGFDDTRQPVGLDIMDGRRERIVVALGYCRADRL